MNNINSEIRIFYSYSHRDEIYREQLEEHLTIFKRQGLIQGWSDRKITGGQEWQSQIDENLRTADLILLLISSSFIASEYCYDKELAIALSRHESGDAYVVPIFVRPGEYQNEPFSGIQGLPKDAKPVSLWDNQDLAWADVASSMKLILAKIREKKQRSIKVSEMKTIRDALIENIETIDHLYNSDKREFVGISTGYIDLDRLTNGLKKGNLFVLASRPAMGKTNLALNIATTVALSDLPIIIFSTKMSARDVSQRMIAITGKINYFQADSGLIQDSDWPKLTSAIQILNDKAILIDESPTLSLDDLRGRCLREKEKFGALALVLIDSVQFLDLKITDNNNLENVGRFLKSLARELDTTILVTSQLNRELEMRSNKRPLLSDLDKVAKLVDEADVVAFVYIDSHYNPDSSEIGTAELIIAKNQSGPIGAIRLIHSAQYGSFDTFVTFGK